MGQLRALRTPHLELPHREHLLHLLPAALSAHGKIRVWLGHDHAASLGYSTYRSRCLHRRYLHHVHMLHFIEQEPPKPDLYR